MMVAIPLQQQQKLRATLRTTSPAAASGAVLRTTVRWSRGTPAVQQQQRGGLAPARVFQELERPQGIPAAQEEPAVPQGRVEDVPPGYVSISEGFAHAAEAFSDLVATEEPHRHGQKHTFRELYDKMLTLAAGLRVLGLQQGDKVSLFSENSGRWLVADQAAMMCGAADAVRGSTAPAEDLSFILRNSGSVGLFVQDTATLAKVAQQVATEEDGVPALKFVLVLWDDTAAAAPTEDSFDSDAPVHPTLGCPVYSFERVLRLGQQRTAVAGTFTPVRPPPGALATLVYTSGTTGHPKGVMLTHGNLAHQVASLPSFLRVSPGQAVLSMLPPWHIYERTVSYYVLLNGVRQVYSSVRRFKEDLQQHPPDHLVAVPLVLDTLYNRVMSRLKAASAVRRAIALGLLSASIAYVRARRVLAGMDLAAVRPEGAAGGGSDASSSNGGAWVKGPLAAALAAVTSALLLPLYLLAQKLVFSKVREALPIRHTVVSGGGSLAAHLDDFYEALGVTVLNGWGMTETSPVLACRTPAQNVRGSVGQPTPGMAIRVVHPDSLDDVPDGTPGLVLVRGPSVMAGYYANEAATAKAFRAGHGWLDTGDLGWRVPAGNKMSGCIVLCGRSKDTIVLASGKNVEPQPIEDALAASPLIRHAIVLGQDKRELGALVYPDEDGFAAAGLPLPAAPAADAHGHHGHHDRQLHDLEMERKVEAVLMQEVARLHAARAAAPHEHVAHVAVCWRPLSIEDGTLTRTMKPRRQEIVKVYAKEAAALTHRLRG